MSMRELLRLDSHGRALADTYIREGHVDWQRVTSKRIWSYTGKKWPENTQHLTYIIVSTGFP